MKKSKLVFFVAIFSALSAALVILYLLRDDLKGCPFCGKLFHGEEDDFEEDDLFEEIEIPVKEEKPAAATKVRRGYIPLRFHQK